MVALPHDVRHVVSGCFGCCRELPVTIALLKVDLQVGESFVGRSFVPPFTARNFE